MHTTTCTLNINIYSHWLQSQDWTIERPWKRVGIARNDPTVASSKQQVPSRKWINNFTGIPFSRSEKGGWIFTCTNINTMRGNRIGHKVLSSVIQRRVIRWKSTNIICYLPHAGFWPLVQQTVRLYIPEDRILQNHLCENFKSYIYMTFQIILPIAFLLD